MKILIPLIICNILLYLYHSHRWNSLQEAKFARTKLSTGTRVFVNPVHLVRFRLLTFGTIVRIFASGNLLPRSGDRLKLQREAQRSQKVLLLPINREEYHWEQSFELRQGSDSSAATERRGSVQERIPSAARWRVVAEWRSVGHYRR